MNKRISTLVAIGFTLLIALGAFTSIALIKGLGATVTRSQASHATTLDVRASVRSLRADYLRRGDAISQLLLDPSRSEAREARRAATTNPDDHLRTAETATGRDDLRNLLGAAAGMGLSRAVGTIARDFEGAAQEVWRQRDHMQAVMTAMRDALMVVDDGTIRMLNQAACALLGYTESELIGSPLGRCVKE